MPAMAVCQVLIGQQLWRYRRQVGSYRGCHIFGSIVWGQPPLVPTTLVCTGFLLFSAQGISTGVMG